MTDDDKKVIELFASGQKDLRPKAISAYRRSLRADGLKHDCVHQRFMSEIDTPVPDLGLRSRYRMEVLRAGKLIGTGSPLPGSEG